MSTIQIFENVPDQKRATENPLAGAGFAKKVCGASDIQPEGVGVAGHFQEETIEWPANGLEMINARFYGPDAFESPLAPCRSLQGLNESGIIS